jgi:hypothetical protein
LGKKKIRKAHEAAERAATKAMKRYSDMAAKYADDLITYHDLNVVYAEMTEAQAKAAEAYDRRYFGKKKNKKSRPDGETLNNELQRDSQPDTENAAQSPVLDQEANEGGQKR